MIELAAFCNPELSTCSRPFSDGIYTYATDNKIIVRVPRVASIKSRGVMEPMPPDAAAMFAKHDAASSPWLPWPPEMKHGQIWQGYCESDSCRDGKVTVDCPVCNGVGYTKCGQCGQDVECRQCGGTCCLKTTTDCPECCGKGKLYQHVARIGSMCFDEKTLARVQITEYRFAGLHMLAFKFDGGDGLLNRMSLHSADFLKQDA